MRLSNRLETIVSLVQRGSRIADVGTDHGYVPIALIDRQIAEAAIALDVREGPLERAAAHICLHGLEKQIELRLSDGLDALTPGEADTVIIAGMGGELALHILEQGRHMWDSVEHWILSPQSDLLKVRRYLADRGFPIVREAMVEEDGKYYTIMETAGQRMQAAGPAFTETGLFYGSYLIQTKDPVLAAYLRKEQEMLTGILSSLQDQHSGRSEDRRRELEHALGRIKEAQHEMQ